MPSNSKPLKPVRVEHTKKGPLTETEKLFILENNDNLSIEDICIKLNRSENIVEKYLAKVNPPAKVEKTPEQNERDSFVVNKPDQDGVATIMSGTSADAVKVKLTKRSKFLRKGF